MYISKYEIDVVTDAAGNATEYSTVVNGRILNVIYQKDGTAPFTDGVDFNVSLEDTAQPIWVESDVNASTVRSPRQKTHATDGTELLYAATGTNVEGYIASAGDRIKVVVSAGGDAMRGKFIVIVG